MIWAMEEKIEINEDFERALRLLEESDSNLFITGKAGTGKSTLLKYFREKTAKNIVVLAPTGVAALNVNGQTIHSFFLIPPGITPERVLEHKLSKKRQELIANVDMIVVDEASMLRADLLDCMDVSLRHHRGTQLPFGGVKMVFIGDLYQLPPVVSGDDEREYFRDYYSSPYFFSAKCLAGTQLAYVELEKIYRQKEMDFVELLNKIRNNTAGLDDLDYLNRRYQARINSPEFVITLTTTNAAANKKNMEELRRLNSECEVFHGEVEGEFQKKSLPTDEELELKVGAQVMMLNNDQGGRWVNGSIGKIHGIEFDELEGDDVMKVKLEDGNVVRVAKHTWNIYKYFFNDELGRIDTEVAGSFRQFPIRLAWAITIHKSQGKTFENAVIDIGRGTFAHGQLYVALSRCRSYSGISLMKRIERRHILVDRKVVAFGKLAK